MIICFEKCYGREKKMVTQLANLSAVGKKRG
jgi:hypothetical protein